MDSRWTNSNSDIDVHADSHPNANLDAGGADGNPDLDPATSDPYARPVGADSDSSGEEYSNSNEDSNANQDAKAVRRERRKIEKGDRARRRTC